MISRVTDYTDYAFQSNIDIERHYVESMLQIYELEKEFILECLQSDMITLEAAEIEEDEKVVKRGIIDRIFDALEALFGTFKKKMLSIVDRDKDFFQNKLNDITHDDIMNCPKFEAIPYWKTDDHSVAGNNLTKVTSGLMNGCRTNDQLKTMDDMKKIVRNVVGGDNEKIARDIENFLNSGQKGQKLEKGTFGPETLDNIWDDIVHYCASYDKLCIGYLKKQIKSVERDARNLERSLNAAGKVKEETTKESFCYLENTSYKNTLISTLYDPFADYVLEADDSSNNKDDKDEKMSSSVKAASDGDSNDNKSDEEKKKEKEQKGNDVEFLKNLIAMIKIIEGSALNVLETRYNTYMNILRFVYNNRKNKSKDNKDETSKEKNDNSETSNDEEKTSTERMNETLSLKNNKSKKQKKKEKKKNKKNKR